MLKIWKLINLAQLVLIIEHISHSLIMYNSRAFQRLLKDSPMVFKDYKYTTNNNLQ